MSQYRKKPVVIEALQYAGDNLAEVLEFTGRHPKFDTWFKSFDEYQKCVENDGRLFKLFTLEGTIEATPGDWIIRGVKGEHYPCKSDIFAATYEPVQAEQQGDGGASEAIASAYRRGFMAGWNGEGEAISARSEAEQPSARVALSSARDVTIDRDLLQSLVDDVEEYAGRHSFRCEETERRRLEIAQARAALATAPTTQCKLCNSSGPDMPCAYPTEINRQQAKRIEELQTRLATASTMSEAVRTLPARQEVTDPWGYDEGGNYECGYANGWNDCLDEIAEIDRANAEGEKS